MEKRDFLKKVEEIGGKVVYRYDGGDKDIVVKAPLGKVFRANNDHIISIRGYDRDIRDNRAIYDELVKKINKGLKNCPIPNCDICRPTSISAFRFHRNSYPEGWAIPKELMQMVKNELGTLGREDSSYRVSIIDREIGKDGAKFLVNLNGYIQYSRSTAWRASRTVLCGWNEVNGGERNYWAFRVPARIKTIKEAVQFAKQRGKEMA